jgi:hypothetical protein
LEWLFSPATSGNGLDRKMLAGGSADRLCSAQAGGAAICTESFAWMLIGTVSLALLGVTFIICAALIARLSGSRPRSLSV